MAKEIRAMVLGATGFMGQQFIRQLADKGVRIVAAVGRNSHLGEDIGKVAGIDALHVPVESVSDLPAIVERSKPNICIDVTDPYFKNLYPNYKILVEHGVNVMTASIEVYYPWATDSKLADELDALCKKNNCTVVASGIQDANWSALSAVLSANCYKIKQIHGENHCTVDYWGKIGADDSRVACSLEVFEKRKAEEGVPQNSYTYALYDIAKTLSLHVTSEENDIVPRISDRDWLWEQEQMMLPAGTVIESKQSCKLETEEGITLDASIFYTFSLEGPDDRNLWEITGEPNINIVTDDMRGDVTTAYNMINRVPDVINAPAGLLTVGDMPLPHYKQGDLNRFVK